MLKLNFEFDAAIFDLDGVIVDTAKYHYLAWKSIASELGISFCEKDNERLKGVSRLRSLEILLEIGGIVLDCNSIQSLAEKKNFLYLEYIAKLRPSDILPGSVELIQVIRQKGKKTALGSASKNANLILQKLGIAHCFDVVIDGNKVEKTKPDPEVFLQASRSLNVIPKRCIVFEDSVAGVQAAFAAGMIPVAIGSREVFKDVLYVAEGLNSIWYSYED
ncbi:MAG: beta-phosphoglucomutase [Clostridia bacterium]|nr:beta-phosphoglucomutase [Clostridia bacterium]